MPLPFWMRCAAVMVAGLLAFALFRSWQEDRRKRAALATELSETKKALAEATARQQERDTHLQEILTTLDAQKRRVQTPTQIVQELPKAISLPAPIWLAPKTTAPTESPEANVASPKEKAPGNTPALPGGLTGTDRPTESDKPTQAVVPAESLKPLFDFALDCKACQERLATAQADLTDEKAKTDALKRERDDALRLARGGSAWRRIARTAKWFTLGAAAGAVATKAAH
jgi:hypothetical protein